MPRSIASRSVAVFMTTLLAFQFWLAASGMFCVMPSMAKQGMSDTMSGAMAMGSADSSAHQRVTGPAAADMPEQMPGEMPCDQRMSLPMCQAMGPCVVALAAALVSAYPAPLATPSRTIALIVVAPPSRSFPPEPPPPRA
jgi:hypothetical protein